MFVCVVIHVFKPLVEFRETHVGTQLLEKDLDKDPAGGSCGLLTHLDTLQHLVRTQRGGGVLDSRLSDPLLSQLQLKSFFVFHPQRAW